jgi:hypothetical protein
VADPALRRLGVPVPGLSTPMGKRHDAHFGVVVREDDAVGEALEDQPPVLAIADPAGQLVRRFEDALEASSRSSPPRPSRRSSYHSIASASSASARGNR